MTRFLVLLSAWVCLFAAPAVAQSISIDDLKARIDQSVGAQAQYLELLSDPDPMRAMVAMEVMMGSGDPTLRRMAVETGIFSSNPAVRASALRAFFAAKPTVSVFMSVGENFEDNQRNWLNSQVASIGGSVSPDSTAFVSLRVADYNADEDCYMNAAARAGCLFRVSDQVVSFRIFGLWNALTLNDAGELTGTIMPYANYPNASARIPVTF